MYCNDAGIWDGGIVSMYHDKDFSNGYGGKDIKVVWVKQLVVALEIMLN